MDPIKALRDEIRAFKTETEDRLRRLEKAAVKRAEPVKVQRTGSTGTYRPTTDDDSPVTPPPSPKKS